MKFKLLFQFSLITLILSLTIIFFYNYFIKDKNEIIIVENKNNIDLDVIKDIRYFSSDNEGNQYEIIASNGIPNKDDPNIIQLENVNAKIVFEKDRKILISSKSAIYNQENYNTKFEKNVLIDYLNHKVSCDSLETIFSENIAILKGNLVYRNLNTELYADIMEIDLITKSSKTYMLNKTNKVKINHSTNGNY